MSQSLSHCIYLWKSNQPHVKPVEVEQWWVYLTTKGNSLKFWWHKTNKILLDVGYTLWYSIYQKISNVVDQTNSSTKKNKRPRYTKNSTVCDKNFQKKQSDQHFKDRPFFHHTSWKLPIFATLFPSVFTPGMLAWEICASPSKNDALHEYAFHESTCEWYLHCGLEPSHLASWIVHLWACMSEQISGLCLGSSQQAWP